MLSWVTTWWSAGSFTGPARNAPNNGIDIKKLFDQRPTQVMTLTQAEVIKEREKLRPTKINAIPPISNRPPIMQEFDDVFTQGYKEYFEFLRKKRQVRQNIDTVVVAVVHTSDISPSEIVHDDCEVQNATNNPEIVHDDCEVQNATNNPEIVRNDCEVQNESINSEIVHNDCEVQNESINSEIVHDDCEVQNESINPEIVHDDCEIQNESTNPEIVHDDCEVQNAILAELEDFQNI